VYDSEGISLSLQEVKDKEQFQVEISNMFATLEVLNDKVDISRAWEMMRENKKM
jgi:hypothetical protein